MKPPQRPPAIESLLEKHRAVLPLAIDQGSRALASNAYPHWDKLRHLEPPAHLASESWWLGIKLNRQGQSRTLPLKDVAGRAFSYTLPDPVLSMLHRIDGRASGRIGFPMGIATEEARDRFVFNSLVEEAITSSQLEGASTTRQVAADMIRERRTPKDKHERMIMNNYHAMASLRQLKGNPLDFMSLMRMHQTLTQSTLDNDELAGRLQQVGEERVAVVDHKSESVLYRPPPADLLPERIETMIRFANEGQDCDPFIHPVIRAITLHFWLAYEHPFADGNGRTARALFYWSMLRQGYWLFEFISISRMLKSAPLKYGRAFLETETDGNDLTYFIIHQLNVIMGALAELDAYLERKTRQVQTVERMLKDSDLNHRQIALLSHAIRHPGHTYTIKTHQTSHRVAYASARSDLIDLAKRDLLTQVRVGQKAWKFIAPENLEATISGKQEPAFKSI
jgi:Fic family protein